MNLFDKRNVAAILGVASLYYAAAVFGLTWAVTGTSATPLWPPAGIAVAALLVFGSRAWPGVLLGAFLAHLMHFFDLPQVSALVHIAGSTGIAIGNLFEALCVYYLSSKLIDGNPFEEVPGIFKFVGISAVSSMISASFGVATMLLMGLEDTAHGPLIFVTWWLGDALAILIVTPFLTSWWPPPNFSREYKWLELTLAFTTLLLLCGIIFGGQIQVPIVSSRPYLFVPPFLWLAFRFSQRELVTGVAVVSIAAFYATANGKGPFVAATLNESFLQEQLFCGMIAITMLVFSASVAKATKYQEELKEANKELERRVADRTLALERKTLILEAINNQLQIETRERDAIESQLRSLLRG